MQRPQTWRWSQSATVENKHHIRLIPKRTTVCVVIAMHEIVHLNVAQAARVKQIVLTMLHLFHTSAMECENPKIQVCRNVLYVENPEIRVCRNVLYVENPKIRVCRNVLYVEK